MGGPSTVEGDGDCGDSENAVSGIAGVKNGVAAAMP
jgi:hypothetical protein